MNKDFNFSKYRTTAQIPAIVKSFWGHNLPEEELEAQMSYKSIDKKILLKYFKDIIENGKKWLAISKTSKLRKRYGRSVKR